ncbi:hypothetical protein CS022_14700 [Veronia nyctiphanis]|uniref:Bacterial Ig-like domain-containing protein n=1 Tax=Veronia nyctiphanis TaxID=1278244 RepID=A0A4V1LSQ9_9GAMM|nr:Ig-like domain-containing protein [Veronia nyctiphanis]RXJ72558.1 hypothetical protein CS022_14700 [Veronia nyctiphanis]
MGNTASQTLDVTIDLQVPEATVAGLDSDSDSGEAGDQLTNVTRPTIEGTAEQDSRVEITVGNQTYLATRDGDKWTYMFDEIDSDGVVNYTVKVTDAAGNSTVETNTLTIDTATHLTVKLSTESDPEQDGYTNASHPKIEFTQEQGATVNVVVTNTATSVVFGNWSYSQESTSWHIAPEIPEGTYLFKVTATDKAGNTEIVEQTYTVDRTNPEKPTAGLSAGFDTGSDTADTITNADQPRFSGNAEPHAKVTFTLNPGQADEVVKVIQTDESGDWSYQLASKLTEDKTYDYTVVAQDRAGNTSVETDGQFTLDTEAPSFSSLYAEDGSNQQLTDWTSKEDAADFSIKGQVAGESGVSSVKLTINGSEIIKQDTLTNGQFTIELNNNLPEGNHTLRFEVEDLAGNVFTKVQTLVIDRSCDLTAKYLGTDTGESNKDGITFDKTPTFTGTTDKNATVFIVLTGGTDNQKYEFETTADDEGNWEYQTDVELSDQDYTWTIHATDPYGNTSESETGNLTIDTVAATFDFRLDSSHDPDGDSITKDRELTFSGLTSEPNCTVKLYLVDGEDPITVKSNADGNFTLTTETLDFQVYDYRVVVTDIAGNESERTGSFTVLPENLDLTVNLDINDNTGAVDDQANPITSVTSPRIHGVASPEATITIKVIDKDNGNNVVHTLTTTADRTGLWDFDLPTLSDNGYAIEVNAVKGDYNQTVTMPLTIDTANNLTFELENDTSDGLDITYANPVKISGQSDPGSTVTVEVGGEKYIAYANESTGYYSVFVTALGNGEHTYTVKSVDKAGNVAGYDGGEITDGAAGVGSFEIDREAPIITANLENDSNIADDGITKNANPIFKGTVTGTYESIYIDLGTSKHYIFKKGTGAVDLVDEYGNWTIELPNQEAGTYNYKIVATDLANNKAEIGGILRIKTDIKFEYSLDEGQDGVSANDLITNNTQLEFSGLTDPKNKVIAKLYGPGDTLLDTLEDTASNSGSYNINFPQTLNDGVYRVVFTVSDLAGNEETFNVTNITLDTTIGNLTVGLDQSAETGDTELFSNANNDGITSRTNPIIAGQGEAEAKIHLIVRDENDNIVLENDTYVSKDGTWSYQMQGLTDGGYSIQATMSDRAGNETVSPVTYDIEVKTSAPSLTWNIVEDTDNSAIISEAEYKAATQEGILTFTGTGDSGDKVLVVIGGQEYYADVGSNGQWSLKTDKLPDLKYPFTVQAIDVAGNITTQEGEIIVDSGISLELDLADDTYLQGDYKTNIDNPNISITTEKDNELTFILRDSNNNIIKQETFVADSTSFNWKMPDGYTYVDGNYSLEVQATDVAGNETTQTINYTVDTTIATASGITVGYNQWGHHHTGADDGVYYTNMKNPDLRIKTDSDTVRVWIKTEDGTTSTSSDRVGGAFTLHVPGSLSGGSESQADTHTVTVIQIDAAGNKTEQDVQLSIKNYNMPFSWQLEGFNKEGGLHHGNLEGTPVLKGECTPGLTVVVRLSGNGVSTTLTALVDDDGNWEVDFPREFQDGVYTMHLDVSDKWHNMDFSHNNLIAIDTFAPAFDYGASGDLDEGNDVLLNTNSGTLSGDIEPGATLVLVIGYGSESPTEVTITPSENAWELDLSSLNLTEGVVNNLALIATDKAGNVTTKAFDLKVDMQVEQLTYSIEDTGSDTTDGVTSNSTISIAGLEAMAVWEYSIDGGITWELGVGASFDVSQGNYEAGDIQIRQTDMAQNVAVTELPALTFDLTLPAATVSLNDLGASDSDNISKSGTITLDNFGEGETWEYNLLFGYGDWVTGEGNSFELAEGNYGASQIQVRITDPAGNVSLKLLSEMSIDKSITALSLDIASVDSADSDFNTRDGVFTVSSVEAGGSWQYSTDGGNNWHSGTGNQFALSAQGSYEKDAIQIKHIDVAGNEKVTVYPHAITYSNLNVQSISTANDSVTEGSKDALSWTVEFDGQHAGTHSLSLQFTGTDGFDSNDVERLEVTYMLNGQSFTDTVSFTDIGDVEWTIPESAEQATFNLFTQQDGKLEGNKSITLNAAVDDDGSWVMADKAATINDDDAVSISAQEDSNTADFITNSTTPTFEGEVEPAPPSALQSMERKWQQELLIILMAASSLMYRSQPVSVKIATTTRSQSATRKMSVGRLKASPQRKQAASR